MHKILAYADFFFYRSFDTSINSLASLNNDTTKSDKECFCARLSAVFIHEGRRS